MPDTEADTALATATLDTMANTQPDTIMIGTKISNTDALTTDLTTDRVGNDSTGTIRKRDTKMVNQSGDTVTITLVLMI